HFKKHTKNYLTGAWRLLVLNSYKSYNLLKFTNFCKEKNIITLYIPLYLSYLL
ncbi:hypothetical protein K432DRAFT_451192, partial [Lepidopterella palustris CBS 459.81]